MASSLVFKLRVHSPNPRDAPIKNRSHIFYIGKRIGVELNKGKTHGLFGKMAGGDFGEVDNIKELADYVHEKTENGTIMYRGIISLKEADAFRLGLTDKEAWGNLTKANIFSMAQKVGVPASRLEYTCAVHLDKGHPHIHLMFWDKKQAVKSAFVHYKIANEIRKDLTKAVFGEEQKEFYNQKNEARDTLLNHVDGFFKNFFTNYANMTEKEFRQWTKEMQQNQEFAFGRLMNTRISPFVLEDFALKIFDFKQRLPKTGRLNFSFLPAEMKSELEDIVTELIFSNPDFATEFESYVEANVTLATYYSDKIEDKVRAREKAEEELLKRLCNNLLSKIKKMDMSGYKEKNRRQQKAFRKTEVLKLFKNLFSFLSKNNESQTNSAYAKLNKQELSKQAKKELAMKMEHASDIEWER